MNPIIQASQLTLDYGKHLALNDISLAINENQLIGLVGVNGSGKSTFMKLCAGLLYPTKGTLNVNQESPINNINLLSQIVYSYPNIPYKATNTLDTLLDYYSMFYKTFDKSFAYKLLDFFSLKSNQKYKDLSQGMTSVFNFICALSTRAKLTLLDEPILGMDVTIRKKVYEILLRDYIENPRTIIISSHILSELEDILSELLFIHEGQIILYMDMDEASTLAYRVDGTEDAVKQYITDKKVLSRCYQSLNSYAIIEGIADESARKNSSTLNLNISRVRPEEYYVYKTNPEGRVNIEWLWEN